MSEASILEVLDQAAPEPTAETPAETPVAQTDIAEAIQTLEQKVNGPTEEEVRAEKLAVLKEQREKLRASREAKRQKTNYEELLKTATQTKDAYSKAMSEWSGAFKDPKQLVEEFKKNGVDPHTLWHHLSEGILGEQTPEAQKLREREQLQQETIAKINPEVEALRKALAAAEAEIRESREFREQYKKERTAYEEYQQQQQAAQSKKDFLEYLDEDDEAAELIFQYGPDYTYNFATQLSQAFESDGRERSFAALKAAMVNAHKQHVLSLQNSREERNKRRKIVPPQSSEQKTPTKSAPKTISNRLATEASNPHPDPFEDDEQREASYRADLKSLFKLG